MNFFYSNDSKHEIVNKTQDSYLIRVDKIYQHTHNQLNQKMDGVHKTKLGMLLKKKKNLKTVS